MFGKLQFKKSISVADTQFHCQLCAQDFVASFPTRKNYMPSPESSTEESKTRSKRWEAYCPRCFSRQWFKRWLMKHRPYVTIPDSLNRPYLRRYYLFSCRRFKIYVHELLRSDTDVLHDHPWDFASLILEGGYTEHQPDKSQYYRPGSLLFRRAEVAHKLELVRPCRGCVREFACLNFSQCSARQDIPVCWSLVLVGPKCREWGFHTLRGWMPWRLFLEEKFGKSSASA